MSKNISSLDLVQNTPFKFTKKITYKRKITLFSNKNDTMHAVVEKKCHMVSPRGPYWETQEIFSSYIKSERSFFMLNETTISVANILKSESLNGNIDASSYNRCLLSNQFLEFSRIQLYKFSKLKETCIEVHCAHVSNAIQST